MIYGGGAGRAATEVCLASRDLRQQGANPCHHLPHDRRRGEKVANKTSGNRKRWENPISAG